MNKDLNGKSLSNYLKKELKQELENLEGKPTLAVIQIGDNKASNTYIRMKERACEEVGIKFDHIKFPENNLEDEIIEKIVQLNQDPDVDGILVQLPIPDNYNRYKIINTISIEKDVDGLTDTNIGCLLTNNNGLVACTPKGIIEILDHYNISITGQHVVIVGRSNLVGKPLSQLLLNRDATVTITHSKTTDLSNFTKQADILIVAAGKKGLITSDMIKPGVVIVDVGINHLDNKLYGDVDYNGVYDLVSYITPVPGGVGPMTVFMLLKNVVISYKNKLKLKNET